MMYNQKLVASIKVKGKVLREFKDTVYIPFASEYSFLIKNLNTIRAVVNVFIDGENVVPGGLVVDPGRTVDLERWIKNGNLSEGNKFKFIERTAAIENGPRGIKLEDGLVRFEYQFEFPRPVINMPQWSSSAIYGSTLTRSISGSTGDWAGPAGSVTCSAALNSVSPQVFNVQASGASFQNETGITVPGSKSEQKFQHITIGALDPTIHNIVLKLVGDLGDNKPVTKPVTVKAKPKCVTCGKQNKAHAKFCSECGTALEIFA
jgi:zinc-ribbon domain